MQQLKSFDTNRLRRIKGQPDVAAQLTHMAQRQRRFIGCDFLMLVEMFHDVVVGVSKTTMPKLEA
jgi:hypothetical protein